MLPEIGNFSSSKSREKLIRKTKAHFQALFQSQLDPFAAYNALKNELKTAGDKGLLHELFNRFVEAPAFQHGAKSSKSYLTFIEKWVRDAEFETDAQTKQLYSDFFHRIRHPGIKWRQFILNSEFFRPGDSLVLTAFSFRQQNNPPSQFKVTIDQLSLDKPGSKPVFRQWVWGHTEQLKRSIRFNRAMNKQGIFRISIKGRQFFQQFYCQVSALDALVKSDGDKMLIWGASLRNAVRPPFHVSLYFEDGQIVKTRTDSNGLCVLRIHRKNLGRSLPFAGIIGRENHLGFLRGSTPVASFAGDEAYLSLVTSSESYPPEQTVHFRGVFKVIKPGGRFLNTPVDSVLVYVRGPDDDEIFRKILPIDGFGQFKGFFDLGVHNRPGQYALTAQPLSGGMLNLKFSGRALRGNAFFKVRPRQSGGPSLALIAAGETQLLSGPISFLVKSADKTAPVSGPILVRWFKSGMTPDFKEEGQNVHIAFFPDRRAVFLAEDTLRLPPSGQLAFQFSHPLPQSSQFLTAEVGTFQDFSRGMTVRQRIKVVPAGVYSHIRFKPEAIRLNKEVRVAILGVPLLPTDSVKAMELSISRNRAKVLSEPLAMEMKNGIYFAETRFLPLYEGDYLVKAVLKISTGREISNSRRFTVTADSPAGWCAASVIVDTDKKQYYPGDTAYFNITGGMDKGCILMSLEQELLRHSSKCYDNGRVGFSVPVSGAFITNPSVMFYFSGKQGVIRKRAVVTVRKKSTLPTIMLTGPRNLKPGELFRGTLEMRDPFDKPMEAAFSLSLTGQCRPVHSARGFLNGRSVTGGVRLPVNRLEEGGGGIRTFRSRFEPGCLSLFRTQYPSPGLAVRQLVRTGDVLLEEAFFNSDAWETNEKQAESFSGRQGLDRGPSFSLSTSPVNESDCGSKILWMDSLHTDSSGHLLVEFTMPDSRNHWNLNLTGSSSQQVFSFNEKLVTRQNLEAVLSMPARLLQNDSCLVVANLVNYTSRHISGEAILEAGIREARMVPEFRGKRPFNIKPMSGTTLVWPYKALTPGLAIQTLRVGYDSVMISDSAVVSIQPAGQLHSISRSGMIKAGDTPGKRYHRVDLNIPETAKTAFRRISLSCYPSLLFSINHAVSHLVSAGGGGLADAVSEVLALQALATVQAAPDSLKNLMSLKTKKLMERLTLRQNLDGGWGWPDRGKSDLLQTAMVLQAVNGCRTQSAVLWNSRIQKLHNKGLTFLVNRLRSNSADDNENALIALVVCSGGRVKEVQGSLNKLFRFRGRLSPYALALLLESLHLSSRNSQAAEVLSLIEDRAFEILSEVSWNGDLRSSWFAKSEEATAWVLKVLAAWYPEHRFISKILPYLSRKKVLASWGSFKTTSAVVSALCRWLNSGGQLTTPQYTGKIFMNGDRLYAFRASGNSLLDYSAVFKVPDTLVRNQNRIVLGYQGNGNLFYSCGLTYYAEKKAAQGNPEMTVERHYLGITYESGPQGKWVAKEHQPNGVYTAGEEVKVVIHVKVYRNFKHVRLWDRLPAGFHYIRGSAAGSLPDSPFTPSYADNGKLAFHAALLERGEYQVSYSMRAIIPGRYRANATCLVSTHQAGTRACADPEILSISLFNDEL